MSHDMLIRPFGHTYIGPEAFVSAYRAPDGSQRLGPLCTSRHDADTIKTGEGPLYRIRVKPKPPGWRTLAEPASLFPKPGAVLTPGGWVRRRLGT